MVRHAEFLFLEFYMPLSVTLSATDLAALLASRICHDLISPVGAINNAMELYDDGGAEEDALQLIRMSAANASARLQFARIAFGAAGSAGMEIDTGDAEDVAQKYMANEKAMLTWEGTRQLLPKNEVKLLLNLILIANGSIPRGGDIKATLAREDGKSRFTIQCSGTMLRVPPRFLELYNGQTPDEPIDAHAIQSYYTLLLAELSNMQIDVRVTGSEIIFVATSK